MFIVFAASFLPGSWNMPQWMHPTVRESHKMYDYIKSVEDITWVATMAPNISDSAYTGNYKVKYVHYLECSKFLFYWIYTGCSKSGGGGFTRLVPRDGGADQFCGIPIVGRLPTDGTRGPEEKGCGRKWPDAEGLVQGSRERGVRDPVVQNHSCCIKESRLNQPCGDKS